MGCVDKLFIGNIVLKELISSKSLRRGNHHHPTNEEREAQDKHLFVYCYNQGGEKDRRDNKSRPYPSLVTLGAWASLPGWYITRKWTKYLGCTHTVHPKYIQNFPCQFSCNFPGLGNSQDIHSVPGHMTAVFPLCN